MTQHVIELSDELSQKLTKVQLETLGWILETGVYTAIHAKLVNEYGQNSWAWNSSLIRDFSAEIYSITRFTGYSADKRVL